ncbi:MAG: hypothetical protein WD877_01940 [Candidatus Saccharimonadales bacterium]
MVSDTMSRTLSVRQEHELLLALEKAGLVPDEAQAIINSKKNQLAKGMVGWLREQLAPAVPTDGFGQYAPYLLSLEDQLARLHEFNRQFWNNWLDEDQFEAAGQLEARIDWETAGREHVQSVNDLQIFYVDFGSPEKNVEMWWKVLAGTQSNAWRWDGLRTDKKHLRLGPNTRQYASGIHRIRINLVANWEPEHGRTVLQVREQASRSGELLAHTEVLAAYGLHDELLRQQDGENLPYADMAGFEATVSGGQPWANVPGLRWRGLGHGVSLSAYWYDSVDHDWAAPLVRES